MPPLVSIALQQQVAIITVNNPPVNALSTEVRAGLLNAINDAQLNQQVVSIIIICEGRTFIAGADINEFGHPPKAPHLPDLVLAIAHSRKPIIAALHGSVLGGGCEIALACHYRVAIKGTKIGLPEVNLGLVPGAGGTQLLPRIVGVAKAIEMIISAKPIILPSTPDKALVHEVTDNDLLQSALKFAKSIKPASVLLKRIFTPVFEGDLTAIEEHAHKYLIAKRKGEIAPLKALSAILLCTQLSLDEGMRKEREIFIECRNSVQSAALRYAFFAEKKAEKPSIKDYSESLKSINKAAIVGAGTMGAGIALCLIASGLDVYLLEINPENLEKGTAYIKDALSASVKKGRINEQERIAQLSHLTPTTEFNDIADADLVIEAAFESMSVKKEIFTKLDRIVTIDCILASNTSYLDINEIASVVNRKNRVIGLHFFSPAHIMKLLEIVETKYTAPHVIASAMAFAKKINKQAALVGVCYGFVGNRMYASYGREANMLLLEGCSPEQIDGAMTTFGMAMGPLAVNDMSGIDIGYKARKENPKLTTDPVYFLPANLMVESNRLGQKTGAGFYLYDEKKRRTTDEHVLKIFKTAAQSLKIKQRTYTDQQISERLVLAMINEGVAILLEGIVDCAETIDTIWLNGYGFPRYKGGPMYYAKQLGWSKVREQLVTLHKETEKDWWHPPSYIDRLMEGKEF